MKRNKIIPEKNKYMVFYPNNVNQTWNGNYTYSNRIYSFNTSEEVIKFIKECKQSEIKSIRVAKIVPFRFTELKVKLIE